MAEPTEEFLSRLIAFKLILRKNNLAREYKVVGKKERWTVEMKEHRI